MQPNATMQNNINESLLHALVESVQPVKTVCEVLLKMPNDSGQHYFNTLNIGRHFRHVYDHFYAVFDGVKSGVVDYNYRRRDALVERDIALSIEAADAIVNQCWELGEQSLPSHIDVVSEVDCHQEKNYAFSSNIERELLYLINHSVHHLAYVKLLLKGENIELPESIGLAPSTASYIRNEGALSTATA